MNITIFEETITESVLIGLEKESETYDGLYVEMDQPEQRKFVKDMALNINGLLKKLDRSRIEKSRDYKVKVESEAALIKTRLEGANKPFTLLIDEYKAVREKQLAKEKARKEAGELARQIPIDHDDALLMDKMFEFEKSESIREQKERDELIAAKAAEAERAKSAQALKDAEYYAILAAEKAKADTLAAEAKAKADTLAAIEAEQARHAESERKEQADQKAREADQDNRKTKNNEAMQCFVDAGLSTDDAKLAVKSIAAKRITNVVINY